MSFRIADNTSEILSSIVQTCLQSDARQRERLNDYERITDMSTPKPAIDKAESRRMRVLIRHVLLEVWDPIGIKDEPNAQDEYDGYIVKLYELLVSHADDSQFVDYLHWAVHDHMGLGAASRSDMEPAVEALKKIRLTPE
jgi:hypothetical protein